MEPMNPSDPYGYADLEVYTFNVDFDKKKGLKVNLAEDSSAQDQLAYFCVVDPASQSPDGHHPFTIFGPYSSESTAQAVIRDGFASDESVVVFMSYTSDLQ